MVKDVPATAVMASRLKNWLMIFTNCLLARVRKNVGHIYYLYCKLHRLGLISVSCIHSDVNECSEGTHNCIDESDCVDAEGSYYCTNNFTTPSTTVTMKQAAVDNRSTMNTTKAPTTSTGMPASVAAARCIIFHGMA